MIPSLTRWSLIFYLVETTVINLENEVKDEDLIYAKNKDLYSGPK